ncbi:hypothetical protein [Aliikangiella sp. IMCC44632]
MGNSKVIIDKALKDYSSMPILPLELSAIARKLRDSSSSNDSFKRIYQRDPAFCWYLIQAGWRATKDKANHPIAADHAMSTIGLNQAKKVFLPLTKLTPAPLSDEVKSLLSSSLLAAEIAKRIGQQIGAGPQIYWTSLQYQLPDIMLWHLKPKQMWRIYYRHLTIPKRTKTFEEAQLGFNLAQWRQQVSAKHLVCDALQRLYKTQLPASKKEIFEYSKNGLSDKTPSLKSWHGYEGGLLVASNRLARSVIVPWHPRAMQHAINLLTQIANLDEKKIKHEVYTAIRTVSENLFYSQLPNPGYTLLLKRSRPHFPGWLVHPVIDPKKLKRQQTVKQAKIVQQKSQEMQQLNPENFKLLLKRLLEMSSKATESGAFIQQCMQQFILTIGYSRASFLMLNHQTGIAETKIALAAKDVKKIRPVLNFNEALTLSAFKEKATYMKFDMVKHEKVWHQLPTAVQQQRVTQFILCSLQPGKKVRAIIYLDSPLQRLFDDNRQVYTRKLLATFNKGLKQINLLKQKQASLSKK